MNKHEVLGNAEQSRDAEGTEVEMTEWQSVAGGQTTVGCQTVSPEIAANHNSQIYDWRNRRL